MAPPPVFDVYQHAPGVVPVCRTRTHAAGTVGICLFRTVGTHPLMTHELSDADAMRLVVLSTGLSADPA